VPVRVFLFSLPRVCLKEQQNEKINLELLMNCPFRSILRTKMRLAATAAVPIIQFSSIQTPFLAYICGLTQQPSGQFPRLHKHKATTTTTKEDV
jgi:hypothetical protein